MKTIALFLIGTGLALFNPVFTGLAGHMNRNANPGSGLSSGWKIGKAENVKQSRQRGRLTGMVTLRKEDENNKGFAVLELFTSEGCSSCPPADALLAKIEKESGDLPVYILAYHVDYWNRLGWTDPFSNAVFSKRQYDYARWLHLSSVYTPQVVVNGSREFVGSDENKLHNAITSSFTRSFAAGITLNNKKISNGQLTVGYEVSGGKAGTSIMVALVQKAGYTAVKRGENQGLKLSHVQIVRQLQMLPLKTNNSGTVIFKLPEHYTAQSFETIAFLQDQVSGEITAATKSEMKADKE